MALVGVGHLAPEFSADGTGNKSYSLHDYRGQVVLLVFYPGDASPVCTEQLNSYSDSFGHFPADQVQTLALSPQDVASHEDFTAQHNFAFPLLYDENKEIGKAYGILGPLGFYRRSTFIIDADGMVRYASRSTAGLNYPAAETLIDAVEQARKPFQPAI